MYTVPAFDTVPHPKSYERLVVNAIFLCNSMTVSNSAQLLERMRAYDRSSVLTYAHSQNHFHPFRRAVGLNRNTVVNYLLYVEVPWFQFEQIITSERYRRFDVILRTIHQDVVISAPCLEVRIFALWKAPTKFSTSINCRFSSTRCSLLQQARLLELGRNSIRRIYKLRLQAS